MYDDYWVFSSGLTWGKCTGIQLGLFVSSLKLKSCVFEEVGTWALFSLVCVSFFLRRRQQLVGPTLLPDWSPSTLGKRNKFPRIDRRRNYSVPALGPLFQLICRRRRALLKKTRKGMLNFTCVQKNNFAERDMYCKYYFSFWRVTLLYHSQKLAKWAVLWIYHCFPII